MDAPVSILMPVRNAVSTLPSTLLTLRAQTCQAFELVIVDDGSTDGSANAAYAVWGNDPRLRILRPGAVGLAQALQRGLTACTTPLVARMDADDLAHPDRLARQVAYLNTHPNVDVVSCQVESFGEHLGDGYRRYDAWLNALQDHADIMRELFVESPLAHPTVCFRRNTVLRVGGYQDPPWPEDYDLWLRLALGGARFAKIPEILHHWRDAPRRTSRVSPRYSREAFLRCKAHYLSCGPLGRHGGCTIWGAGDIGRRLGRALRKAGCEVRAHFDIDIRKIGRTRGVDTPVLHANERDAWRGLPMLGAVGNVHARAEIRAAVAASGWREGEDFWCAA